MRGAIAGIVTGLGFRFIGSKMGIEDSAQEWASVLIGDVWRACPRPGRQWDEREMGISSGRGPRGMRRAVETSREFQANRDTKPTNNVLHSERTEAARMPSEPLQGRKVPIMGGPVKPLKRGKPTMPDTLALAEGRNVRTTEWGTAPAQIDVFFHAVAVALMNDNGAPSKAGVLRSLMIQGLDSLAPEHRDDIIARAELIAGEFVEDGGPR